MKTTRYRFEQVLTEVKTGSDERLKEELRAILESDKEFTRKSDYIGLSIAHLDAQVVGIDEEIKELQELKRRLKSAKDITLKAGAEVFAEYGIEKLEGSAISSITIAPASQKVRESMTILNPCGLKRLGYFTLNVDEEKVWKAYKENEEKVYPYIKINKEETKTPAKLKVNKRKAKSKTTEEIVA